ncbi:DUF1515 family protein [Mycoplana rhizolycopersici]|uniref:DUF1515 family protein n=1 Tax=Mycoplana rhizolycopersici TaxID=2746702 RepID=UPI003CCDE50C
MTDGIAQASGRGNAVVYRRTDEIVSRVGHLGRLPDEARHRRRKAVERMGIGALGVIGIGGIALGVTFTDAIGRIGMVIIGKS